MGKAAADKAAVLIKMRPLCMGPHLKAVIWSNVDHHPIDVPLSVVKAGYSQIQLLGTRCVQASSNLYKRTCQLRYVQASCAASCSENYKTNIMHRLLGKNGVE